jgi:hypothetical protein
VRQSERLRKREGGRERKRELLKGVKGFSFSAVITWKFSQNIFCTSERWRGENFVNFPNFRHEKIYFSFVQGEKYLKYLN